MAIIKGNISQKKVIISARIGADILDKIHQYCAWSKVNNINLFIEESSLYFINNKKNNKEKNDNGLNDI